jgi:ribulose-bisphosphate carboxylase large chain
MPPAALSFADMLDGSPASLAKLRARFDAAAREEKRVFESPVKRSTIDPSAAAALGAAFAEMMSASPANLVTMRERHDGESSTPTSSSVRHLSRQLLSPHPAPSTISLSPRDDATRAEPAPAADFADMFAASPATLAKLRAASRARDDHPHGGDARASGKKHRASIDDASAADPGRFDDMFAASPAQLAKLRAASARASPSGASSSSFPGFTTTSGNKGSHPYGDDRFVVVYDVVAADETECREKVLAICLEQTVELPASLVPEGTWIRENVVGRLEKLTPRAGLRGSYRCEISYHADTAGNEISQLINVVFGNTSMKEGVMVADLIAPPSVLAAYPGPKFGVRGLRKLLGVPRGPMIMTALKPMGSSTAALAEMAYKFAKGGIDVVKDDHGLADQPYSPYDERVVACAAAVRRANEETGRRCIYAPCVNAPAHLVAKRAFAAKAAGAGAVLMIPGITGLDTMRELADDESFGLPIICHPAMLGAMLGGGSYDRVGGFSHEVLLGALPRVAGADATIFPSFGGRFGFSVKECEGIARGARRPMGGMPDIFPSPGGGMTMERVAAMNEVYGEDVLLLIGGSLMGHSPDLVANAKHFMKIAGRTDLYGPKENGGKGGGAGDVGGGGKDGKKVDFEALVSR